jgi:hypothetical protein
MVAEGAEQENVRPARHYGGGNGGGASTGLDGKRCREGMLGTAAIRVLESITPARVALVVAAPTPRILRSSPGGCSGSRSAAWLPALPGRPFAVGRTASLVTCPATLG